MLYLWYLSRPRAPLVAILGVPRRGGIVGGAADQAQRRAGRLGGRPEEVVVSGRHFLRVQGHQATAAGRVRGMCDDTVLYLWAGGVGVLTM